MFFLTHRNFIPKTIYILLFIVIPGIVAAQEFSGTISDSKGKPIPYATIFIRELSQGTTTNVDGEFYLEIPEGTYNVSFRSMGYDPLLQEIVIDKNSTPLQITLKDQVVQIREIKIYGTGEDPAYPIMRKVIGMANYHQNQVDKYVADVYLRGTVNFRKVSRLMRKQIKRHQDVDVKTGDTFVNETVSKITFEAPDKYEQEIISVNSTFPSVVDIPVSRFFSASMYQPNIDILISPLAKNAFSHYKFRYEGFDYDGPYTINKIKVIPRRKSRQLFSGYIYVIEDLWCLHRVDLKFDMPFGEILVRQVFEEVRDRVWLAVGHNYEFDGGAFGVEGSIRFGASIRYSDLLLNQRLLAVTPPSATQKFNPSQAPKETPTEVPLTKVQKKRRDKMEEILEKDELTKSDMNKLSRLMDTEADESHKEKGTSLEIIEEEVVLPVQGKANRDTSYWANMRPIPLTEDEIRSFEKRDSILMKAAPKNLADSIARSNNRFLKTMNNVFFGKKTWNRDSTFRISFPGLINLKNIQFNPVDGFRYTPEVTLRKIYDPGHILWITPSVGYAFSRKAVLWEVKTAYSYSPMRRGMFNFDFGQTSKDFNSQYGIHPFLNTASTLLFKENYARHYEDRYIRVANRIDIVNGLVFYAGFDWHDRRELNNTTDFSFFKPDDEYAPNIPNNDEITAENLADQKASIIRLKVEYTPQHYYRIKKGVKHMEHTAYPTIWLKYDKGIRNLFNSSADFDYLETGITHRIKTAPSASVKYSFRAGWLFNDTPVHFADFAHTNTQSIPFLLKEFRSAFFIPDYYELATAGSFMESHISYKAPYIALKYLPGLTNTLWREMIWASHYTKHEGGNYFEAGYSLLEILYSVNIGIFVGFDDFEFRGVGFNLVLKL